MVSFWYILKNIRVTDNSITLDDFVIWKISNMDIVDYKCSRCGSLIQEHFKEYHVTTPLGDNINLTKERFCHKCNQYDFSKINILLQGLPEYKDGCCKYYQQYMLHSCDLFKFFTCRYIDNFGECPVVKLMKELSK
jgi:hypothetical protein